MSRPSSLHLAVALDGAGWHPAAWREPQARPGELLTARYWADLISQAERGLLDSVTIEDCLGLQPAGYGEPTGATGPTNQVRGRLDAVLIAARVAPLTRNIGLVPTVVVTHTEPFHISKAIATLDYVSTGRAGLRVQVTARQHEAAHFGRRTFPRFSVEDRADPAIQQLISELFDEPPTTSRSSGGCGTAGRTTPRSATSPPAGSSTGRSCTTSTLPVTISASGAPSITPRPPQGSRS